MLLCYWIIFPCFDCWLGAGKVNSQKFIFGDRLIPGVTPENEPAQQKPEFVCGVNLIALYYLYLTLMVTFH